MQPRTSVTDRTHALQLFLHFSLGGDGGSHSRAIVAALIKAVDANKALNKAMGSTAIDFATTHRYHGRGARLAIVAPQREGA